MEQKALTVSVAMAVKNGLPYLEKQLHSIFSQLGEGDEIVLSLDANDTETMPYLEANPHPFLRVVRAEQAGVLPNFQNALAHCQKEIVFLADQDDVWLENKVSAVKNAFLQDQNLLLVMHDA
jgi:glycosyltransferase involved in cell wall biosynthesis